MTTRKQILNSLAAMAIAALAPSGALAEGTPQGELPFGVYDPPGDFANESDVQIEHIFLPWEDVFLPSLLEADRYALDRNRAILMTIEPWTWNRSERNSADILIASLLSGDYDHYMRDICNVVEEMESPITIRWAQEMDDYSGQFIWAGWKPETYIEAFRRMVDICREEAPRVNVMWSPLGYENMAEFYPGDDYVDLVGLSVFGYQQWEEDILGRALSFEEILEPRYQRALQFNKPITVSELGYRGDQEYVAKWDNEVRQRNPKFPNLVGVVYFNQREVYPWPDNYGLPDWRVNEHVLLN